MTNENSENKEDIPRFLYLLINWFPAFVLVACFTPNNKPNDTVNTQRASILSDLTRYLWVRLNAVRSVSYLYMVGQTPPVCITRITE